MAQCPRGKTVMSGIPQEPVLGSMLFNIFINNIDSGIEYKLSKFTGNTKLTSAADTLEARNAVQRGLDRLKKWAHRHLVIFNKEKGNILHLDQEKPQYQYS
ncbi:rna-directed dna polymerase from mobile element jockey-like [Willisornis vidua]|uniref:Rna-directed dna polymerase from mobile element jockey-like n=1 Tax=Willisornis vidua TaxID=1566151 RepID=A0ABQ9DG31_9PASS|nr:rna-directed dna polymerase from mobile element jockey-like [Willisornis vidua]